jgi:hypothetical protein
MLRFIGKSLLQKQTALEDFLKRADILEARAPKKLPKKEFALFETLQGLTSDPPWC